MITHSHAQRRGVALVLVLAFLVLISVFIVGFFVSASSELRASSGYAATVTTQQLSETATNIVMGQIREATTRPGEVWASQPGLLRTYRTTLPESFYKLYSAEKMVVEGQGSGKGEASVQNYRPMDADVPVGSDTGWNHKPALFVDLNDPVRVPLPGSESGVSGKLNTDYEYRYPILDPSAFYLRNTEALAGDFLPTSATVPTNEKRVEGAELIKNPADDSASGPNGADKLTTFTRMPVRWLYILKDGTVTCPDGDLQGTIAQWSGSALNPQSVPSANNPIVGRIAFWTDDDTCKVNINTAAGFTNLRTNSAKNEDDYAGSYWDSPRFLTKFDRGSINTSNGDVLAAQMSLALAQPVRNEFQRYPGHPATTSLGLVFKNLLSSSQIYALTPRLNGGGSDGGTRRLIQALNKGAADKDNKSLSLRHDRLYASVDELLFAAPQKGDAMTDARRLNSKELTATGITPELVNRMRFFLTAHSRSPELNVFGRPRISTWPLWPIYTAASEQHSTAANFSGTGTNPKSIRSFFRQLVNENPTEKLIAFCSTVGPKDNDSAVRPYFFQRANPYSATEDALIPRNRALFDYISKLMGQPVLGSAGATTLTPKSFKDKYPGEESPTDEKKSTGDYNQIIAEIFDYIRCVNLNDTSHDIPAPGTQTATPSDAGYVYGQENTKYKYSPHGYVVPSVVSSLRGEPAGFGRFPTLSEAVLVFYHAGYAVWEWDETITPPRKVLREILSRRELYDTYNTNYSKKLPNGQPDIANSKYGPLHPKTYTKRTPPADPATATSGKLVLDTHGKPQFNENVLGTYMRAFVLFEGFNPMQGYTAETGFNLTTEVQSRQLFFQHDCTSPSGTGMNLFTVDSEHMVKVRNPGADGLVPGDLKLPPSKENKFCQNRFWDAPWGAYNSSSTLGGQEGFFHTMLHCYGANPPASQGALVAITDGMYYPFQSTPKFAWPTNDGTPEGVLNYVEDFPVPGTDTRVYIPTVTKPNGLYGVLIPKQDKQFVFSGGKFQLKISFSGTTTGANNLAGAKVVSTFELNFPESPKKPTDLGEKDPRWPVPTDNIWAYEQDPNTGGGFWHEDQAAPPMDRSKDGRASPNVPGNPVNWGDQARLSSRIKWTKRHAANPWAADQSPDDTGPPDGLKYGARNLQLLQPGDTIRSLIPFNPNSKREDVTVDILDPKRRPLAMGDPRTLSLVGNISTQKGDYMKPHPNYMTSLRHAQGLRGPFGPYFGGRARDYDEFNEKSSDDLYSPNPTPPTPPTSDEQARRMFETNFGTMLRDPRTSKPMKYQAGAGVSADLPPNVQAVFRNDGLRPDFDTGLANSPDGGYLNKSDEGTVSWRSWDSLAKKWYYNLPYYVSNREGGYDTYFSPNKQMPSAVQFGSLLSGRYKHWQTLAFCPNALGEPHPGITADPKDHYLLDLFNMPVVEPYAISEPFSTSGKVNLNYAMAPFNHIRRSTAMRAILHPVRIVAVPNDDSDKYKGDPNVTPSRVLQDRNFRFRVNRDETLKAFDAYFNGKSTGRQEIFRTGSQICEMYLYPNMYLTETANASGAAKKELTDIGIALPKYSAGNAAMRQWWERCVLTGDNLREKPYNDIYPRITTKSNTYTVHMWVQALKKNSTAGMTPSVAESFQRSWNENKEQVIAEYRGSTTIERYIDPEDRRFDPKNVETVSKGDYIDPDLKSIEPLYRFRVVESKRFAP